MRGLYSEPYSRIRSILFKLEEEKKSKRCNYRHQAGTTIRPSSTGMSKQIEEGNAAEVGQTPKHQSPLPRKQTPKSPQLKEEDSEHLESLGMQNEIISRPSGRHHTTAGED